MQVVGGGGGSCLSAGEEFCEKFRLQLLSLIEKIAKKIIPQMGEIFYLAGFAKLRIQK